MTDLMELARKIEAGNPAPAAAPAPAVAAPVTRPDRAAPARRWTTRTARGFRNYAPKAETLEKRRNHAEKVLRDRGMDRAWEIFANAEGGDNPPYEEKVIRDIVGRLARWGHATDKALDYAAALVGKIGERAEKAAEIAAERAAEHDAALPVPEYPGRMVVEGEVLTVKEKVGRYGPVMKMLVRHDDGWKVWGTRPASLADAERGDRVRFEAKVERSRDDEKFGFFSRPTHGDRLEAVPDDEMKEAA